MIVLPEGTNESAHPSLKVNTPSEWETLFLHSI